jgi:hypothetical protein
MEIIDLGGKTIVISDLEKAITQSDLFRTYTHTDPAFQQLDSQLQAYWQDIYGKLMQLRQKVS